MTLLLGIDPGKEGGIALLDTEANSVETWFMPDTTRTLHDLIAGLPKVYIAAIERPFALASGGTANALRTGIAYGVLLGALAWRDIPFREVRPVDWKKSMGVPKDKTAARQAASQMWPDCSDQWKLKKHDGRAEAALLAAHAMGWRVRASA